MARKIPDPIDAHVGSRIRLRRMLIGLSQEKLGDALGLTFQQVQKYEKGANRIGSSRLYKIAHLLGVSIQFFFDDLQAQDTDRARGFAEPGAGPMVMDFFNTSEGVHLNRAFANIKDTTVRKRLVDLVKALGEPEPDA